MPYVASAADMSYEEAIQHRHRDAEQGAQEKVLRGMRIAVDLAPAEYGLGGHHQAGGGEALGAGDGDGGDNDHAFDQSNSERCAGEGFRFGHVQVRGGRRLDGGKLTLPVGRRGDQARHPGQERTQGRL